jgi:hypothetical protein
MTPGQRWNDSWDLSGRALENFYPRPSTHLYARMFGDLQSEDIGSSSTGMRLQNRARRQLLCDNILGGNVYLSDVV